VHASRWRQATPLAGLHVLVWDPHEKNSYDDAADVAAAALGQRGVDLSNHDVPLGANVRLQVTRGDRAPRPGLILDFTSSGRERVLVWAE